MSPIFLEVWDMKNFDTFVIHQAKLVSKGMFSRDSNSLFYKSHFSRPPVFMENKTAWECHAIVYQIKKRKIKNEVRMGYRRGRQFGVHF